MYLFGGKLAFVFGELGAKTHLMDEPNVSWSERIVLAMVVAPFTSHKNPAHSCREFCKGVVGPGVCSFWPKDPNIKDKVDQGDFSRF